MIREVAILDGRWAGDVMDLLSIANIAFPLAIFVTIFFVAPLAFFRLCRRDGDSWVGVLVILVWTLFWTFVIFG
jgi:hypothetical protein